MTAAAPPLEAHVVIENGAVIAARGAEQPVPWWSFTKTVIAAAALVLVDEGRLALDDPLPRRAFTLRQLLQHTAGVANYGELAAYHDAVARNDEPWPVADVLARTEPGWSRYPPGQGWGYSNIGYLFARQCIEEAAGEDVSAALTRLVLRPLGIEGARLAQTRADLDGVALGEAAGYHPGWVYHGLLVGPLAAGCRLLERLMAGRLLPAPLLAEMCSQRKLGGAVPGRPWRTHGYGLGLMIGTTAWGERVLGHTGGGPGSTLAVYHLPDRATPRTAAAFAFGDDEGSVERAAFGPAPARPDVEGGTARA
jgi:CubicO group peptidase (beta-lactamase class C family)